MGRVGHRSRGGAVGVLVLTAAALAGLTGVAGPIGRAGGHAPASRSGGPAVGSGPAVVDHVVDGDTLNVRVGGRIERVRTVQIDAPESSSTRFGRPDACGRPSTLYAETLTRPGATVWLEYSGRDRTDRYGRLLALVHLDRRDGPTWQERMVRAGWAEVFVYRGNTTRLLSRLTSDQAYAKAHRLGVYARCGGRFHDSGG
jgi:endonuclease YncB( thermonuclease family)